MHAPIEFQTDRSVEHHPGKPILSFSASAKEGRKRLNWRGPNSVVKSDPASSIWSSSSMSGPSMPFKRGSATTHAVRSESLQDEISGDSPPHCPDAARPPWPTKADNSKRSSRRMSWLNSKVRRSAPTISAPLPANPPVAPSSPAPPRSASEFTLSPEFTTQLETMSPVFRCESSTSEQQSPSPMALNNPKKRRETNAVPPSSSLLQKVLSDPGQFRPLTATGPAPAVPFRHQHHPHPGREASSRGRGSSQDYSSRMSSSPHRSSRQGSSLDPSSRLSSSPSSPRILVQEKIIDPAFLLAGRFAAEPALSPDRGGKLVALSPGASDMADKLAMVNLAACRSQDSLLRVSVSDTNCLRLSFDGPLPSPVKSEGLAPAPPKRNSRAAACRCAQVSQGPVQHDKKCPVRTRGRSRTLSQVTEMRREQPVPRHSNKVTNDQISPVLDFVNCGFDASQTSPTSYCLTPTFGEVDWAAGKGMAGKRQSQERGRVSSLQFMSAPVSPKTLARDQFPGQPVPLTRDALRRHERRSEASSSPTKARREYQQREGEIDSAPVENPTHDHGLGLH